MLSGSTSPAGGEPHRAPSPDREPRTDRDPRTDRGSELAIRVNGEPRRVAPGTRLADLLGALGIASAAVAVERNRRLVPARDHATTVLAAGDELEIVTLVGGG